MKALITVGRVFVSLLLCLVLYRNASQYYFYLKAVHSDVIGYDATAYLSIGKRLLEGGVLYRDYLDLKLPGIFYLSAFGWWLYGSTAFTASFTTAASLLLCALPLLLVSLESLRRGKYHVPECVLAALCIGTSLATGMLPVALQNGGYAAGFFAAAALSLFVLAYAFIPRQWHWLRVLALSLSLFASCILREFALIAVLAIVLIWVERRRDFFWDFIAPFGLAALAGVLTLILGGGFSSFFQLYPTSLLELLGDGVSGEGSGLYRALRASRADVQFLFQRFTSGDRQAGLLGFSLLGLGMLAVFLHRCEQWRAQNALTAKAVSLELGRVAAILLLFYLCPNVNVRSYRVYILPSFPLIIAFVLVLFRFHATRRSATAKLLTYAMLVLPPLVFPQQQRSDEIAAFAQRKARLTRETRTLAKMTDAVLDACGVEEYLYVGKVATHPGVQIFTKHPASGPLLFQAYHWINGQLPPLRRMFVEQLESAKVVVLDTRSFDRTNFFESYDELLEYLSAHYTEQLPACAASQEKLPATHIRLFFRPNVGGPQ